MYCNPQDKILEFIQLELNNSYKNPSLRTARASEGQTTTTTTYYAIYRMAQAKHS